MRKFLAIPVILFPYTLLLGLYCLYTGFLMEDVFRGNGYLLIAALFLCALIAFGFTLGICISALVGKADGRGMARLNMAVKLCHVPAYIAVFLLSLLFLISIWGIGFVVVFVLYDLAAIGMTGLIGAVSTFRSVAEGKLTKAQGVAFALLQFVFCADIVVCILLYIRSGGRKAEANAASEG